MPGWTKNPSASRKTAVLFVAAVLVTLSAGYWVNVYTSEQSKPGDPSMFDAIWSIGWANAALVIFVGALAVQLFAPGYWRTRAEGLYQESVDPTLRTVLQVAIDSYQATMPKMLINARYFAYAAEKDRRTLRPVEGIHVTTDPMPDEFGLDEIDLDQDSYMVVCKAFAAKAPVYSELTEEDAKEYRPEIKGNIDPGQTWVLACPVLTPPNPKHEPLGVVCLYGRTTPVKSGADERALKQLAVSLAKAYARILQAHGQLAQYGP